MGVGKKLWLSKVRGNKLYNTQKAKSLVLAVLGLDMAQHGKVGYCMESE